MTDGFGKRTEFNRKAGTLRNGTVAPASAGDTPRRGSNRLGGIGEVASFVGLMLVILAVLVWPSDPEQPRDLGGSIYLSRTFQILFPFDSPPSVAETVSLGTTILDFTHPVVLLAFLVGLLAIWGERWILAGLVVGFFLFPLDRLGYHVYGVPDALTTFLVLIVFRLMPFRPIALLLAIPAVIGTGLLLRPIADEMSKAVMLDRVETAPYLRISFAALVENRQPRVGMADGYRVATLTHLPVSDPILTAAKAYVVAQELALGGDPAGAEAALKSAASSGFAPNTFDQQRMEVIRRYAAASHVFGPDIRDVALSGYRRELLTAWAAGGVGVVLAIAGWLVGTTRRLRARRLLDETAAVSPATGRGIAVYRISLAALGVIALVAFAGYSFFHLPGSASNTAFTDVALTDETLETLLEAGVTLRQENWSDSHWPIAALYLGFGAPLILLLLMLRYRRTAMAASVAILFAAAVNATLFDRAVSYAVTAAALGPETRQKLAAAIANPDRAFLSGSEQPVIVDPRSRAQEKRATRIFPELARIDLETAKAAVRQVEGMFENILGTRLSTIEKFGTGTSGADIPAFVELPLRGGSAPPATLQDLAGSLPMFSGPSPEDGRARIKRVDESQKAKAAARIKNAPSGAGDHHFQEVKAVVPPLGGAHAAYTLAQAAYLEDRPADARLFLEQIKDRRAIGYHGHLQRLDLIRDWTAAKGYPVAPATSVGSAPPIMAETRNLANTLLQIALAAAGLALLTLAGWVIAARRRQA